MAFYSDLWPQSDALTDTLSTMAEPRIAVIHTPELSHRTTYPSVKPPPEHSNPIGCSVCRKCERLHSCGSIKTDRRPAVRTFTKLRRLVGSDRALATTFRNVGHGLNAVSDFGRRRSELNHFASPAPSHIARLHFFFRHESTSYRVSPPKPLDGQVTMISEGDLCGAAPDHPAAAPFHF